MDDQSADQHSGSDKEHNDGGDARHSVPAPSLIGRLRNYFLAGVLVTAPLAITIWLSWIFITFVDNRIMPLLPPNWHPDHYLPFSLPGLGVLIVFLGLTLVGMLTAGFVGRAAMRQGERLLNQVPVVRSLYSAIKQIFETVLKQNSDAFRQVVMVEYPEKGTWVVGFVTGAVKGEVQRVTTEDVIAVFVPATPNPTTGFLIFLPADEVHVLDMTVEQGLKLVISGGIVLPPADQHPKASEVPLPPLPKGEKKKPGFLARIRNYFFAGVLVTAPIFITTWLAWELISWIDAKVMPFIPARFQPESYIPEVYLPFGTPGLGVIIVVVGLTLIGMLTFGFIGRWWTRASEALLNRLPVVRSVYSALKQIMETVLSSRSDAFRECVLFNYPRKGVWAIGFITGKTQGQIQSISRDKVVNVFLPTTPNPTSGFLLFVPEKDVIHLGMNVEEGLKMVVSGGLVVPEDRGASVSNADSQAGSQKGSQAEVSE
ncbi:DUF502 domain-containing protein [Rhodovibrionaceae bacterium A322]